jgi:hypothetical protein
MTKKKSTERRSLKTSANYMFVAFKAQGGSLEKALLEGAMNCEDAGATGMRFIVGKDKIQIIDDGKGMNRREIEEYFEVIGAEHEMDDDGYSSDAKFGTFRMGRGQLFVYGKNTWRTGTHEMTIDMKKDGVEYDLVDGYEDGDGKVTPLKEYNGCAITIELYDTLDNRAMRYLRDRFKELVQYMDIPVWYKDDNMAEEAVINTPPKDCTWTHETDEFYIATKNNSRELLLYQQGVFVERIFTSTYGVGGVAVSKKPLKLNLSRNAVIRGECPRWKRLDEYLKSLGDEKLKDSKNKNPNEDERFAIAERIMDPCSYGHGGYKGIRFLRDVNGKCWSPQMIKAATRRFELTAGGEMLISVGAVGDNLGCRIMDFKKAIVFDQDILDQHGLDLEGLKEIITKVQCSLRDELKTIPLEKIDASFKDKAKVLQDRDLNKGQKIFCEIMSRVGEEIVREMVRIADDGDEEDYYIASWEKVRKRLRRITIGEWKGTAAFTDGSSFIAFDKNYVAEKGFGLRQWPEYLVVLVHEYCHEDSDMDDSHNHTFEFYEKFHELMHKAYKFQAAMGTAFLKKSQSARATGFTKKEIKDLEKLTHQLSAEEIFQKSGMFTPGGNFLGEDVDKNPGT